MCRHDIGGSVASKALRSSSNNSRLQQQQQAPGQQVNADPAGSSGPGAERHHGPNRSPAGARAPKLTEPLFMRPTSHDYTYGKPFFPNPLRDYTATNYPEGRFTNVTGLDSLLRDGKIYLSLSDAVMLALEDNYDIAIARINLDIADTDVLRAKAGATLRGVSTGLVENTHRWNRRRPLPAAVAPVAPRQCGSGWVGLGRFGPCAEHQRRRTSGSGFRSGALGGQFEFENASTPAVEHPGHWERTSLSQKTFTYDAGYTQYFHPGTELERHLR